MRNEKQFVAQADRPLQFAELLMKQKPSLLVQIRGGQLKPRSVVQISESVILFARKTVSGRKVIPPSPEHTNRVLLLSEQIS